MAILIFQKNAKLSIKNISREDNLTDGYERTKFKLTC